MRPETSEKLIFQNQGTLPCGHALYIRKTFHYTFPSLICKWLHAGKLQSSSYKEIKPQLDNSEHVSAIKQFRVDTIMSNHPPGKGIETEKNIQGKY